ncbi:MAG: malto-oligosyltrehalose synthase [Polyangia bacterium]
MLGPTYRLQLTPSFGFVEAQGLLGYLAQLGITDLYTSPLLAAAHGSTHGYDVVDHERLNPQLGGEADFSALCEALKARGMGLLVDWVPNHMGVAPGQNPWWEDLLENGPSSVHSETFDIDWRPPKEDFHNTILLPVLGSQYGEALERGELRVIAESGRFFLTYYEHRFPLAPKSLLPLVEQMTARTGLAEDDEAQQELESIRTAIEHLPSRLEIEPHRRRERAREKEIIKRRLCRLLATSAPVRNALGEVLAEINNGSEQSIDALDRMLSLQSYRLASWRVASEEINYRRFFDVNSLAAIRMESSAVFERAHALLFRLIGEQRIQALRLDHTDGLSDPLAYFESVQRRFRRTAGEPAQNPDDAARPLPLLVEKILEPGERLPAEWPVDGTTGYEFASAVLGLWVVPGALEPLTLLHRQFTGDVRTYEQHVYECKRQILADALASEVNMLARHLERIAAANRRWRDFTLIDLTEALVETLAAFPVYRTYVRTGAPPSEDDAARIHGAIRAARLRARTVDESVFTFLEDMLLLRGSGGGSGQGAERARDLQHAQEGFAMRFQQLTGPVMAKSVEDTAFYRYNRLLTLNEVGSDPTRFGTSIDAFHSENIERLRAWPLSQITTSTHDSKRGEDAGARIAVLSEMPLEWRRVVTRWSRTAERYRELPGGRSIPSRRDEYTLYQALVGAWPIGWDGKHEREAFVERAVAFFAKAIKEEKEETSWVRPDAQYEEASRHFALNLLHDDDFMSDCAEFCAQLAPFGAVNSLAQTLLRTCSPGIPDTYQGAELWHQSFVDPDNRRPVDFVRRQRILASIVEGESRGDGERGRLALARELLDRWEDGGIKMYVMRAALRLRAGHRDLFMRGDYEPLSVDEHVVAFLREPTHRGTRIGVIAPRFTCKLLRGARGWPVGAVWGERQLRLPAGRYRDVLTGEEHVASGPLHLSALLAHLPVALLISEGEHERS